MAAEKQQKQQQNHVKNKNEIKTKITKFFVPCHERIQFSPFSLLPPFLSISLTTTMVYCYGKKFKYFDCHAVESTTMFSLRGFGLVWLFFAWSWIDSIIFTIFHRNKSNTNGIKLVFPIQVLSFPFDFRMSCNVHQYIAHDYFAWMNLIYMFYAKHIYCANSLLPNYFVFFVLLIKSCSL